MRLGVSTLPFTRSAPPAPAMPAGGPPTLHSPFLIGSTCTCPSPHMALARPLPCLLSSKTRACRRHAPNNILPVVPSPFFGRPPSLLLHPAPCPALPSQPSNTPTPRRARRSLLRDPIPLQYPIPLQPGTQPSFLLGHSTGPPAVGSAPSLSVAFCCPALARAPNLRVAPPSTTLNNLPGPCIAWAPTLCPALPTAHPVCTQSLPPTLTLSQHRPHPYTTAPCPALPSHACQYVCSSGRLPALLHRYPCLLAFGPPDAMLPPQARHSPCLPACFLSTFLFPLAPARLPHTPMPLPFSLP